MTEAALPPCLDGGFLPPRSADGGLGAIPANEPESLGGVAWGERHLQCIWADPRLRPELATTAGEPVAVVDPGAWNGGPGPDFKGATVEIGGVRKTGDVEIHVRPGDWAAHGHSSDPAYRDVVLHVAWFPPRPGVPLPDIPLALLSGPMLARGGFSFDQIDPESYPWGGQAAETRPCSGVFAGAPAERVHAVLEAAGRARALRKAREIANRAALAQSPVQAFYEEIMAALGWRANEGAMRRLAGLATAADLAALPTDFDRYALLLGRAGLLPREPSKAAPREWLDALWAAAFRLGATDGAGSGVAWALGATRPANHPRVRLAAAAAMFARPAALRDALFAIPDGSPKAWFRTATKTLVDAAAPGAALLPQGAAKTRPLGPARASAMLVNAVIPALADARPGAVALLDAAAPEDVGAAMKETAYRLFGPDHNPALLYASSALRTQGLLELWRGRCRSAPDVCAECPFAGAKSGGTRARF